MSTKQIPGETILIEADNPNIRYMGRIDFSNPKEPRFDWPGVAITAVFEGSYCGIALHDGGNNYNVFIDDALFSVISTKSHVDLYDDVRGLAAGPHTLCITKRTEGSYGIGTFRGLYLEKGMHILEPPARSSLLIEFIGDSISCGYGNEGGGVLCLSLRETENNYLSYCAIASRELGADFSVIAISGKGVVRNFGDTKKISREPMPLFYDRVLGNDPTLTWDFGSHAADIVVITLGSNDYMLPPQPDSSIFASGYTTFLDRVRQNYPNAEIFCACGTMSTHPQCEIIEETVNRYIARGDDKVHLVGFPSFSEEYGCDWHPNVEAHKAIARVLVAEIRKYHKQ